ncbi:BspA family leucine-rich repeat surface protein [Companilactobacillus kedongensis]|uniref:BspA family leucine-rich repeat surface protein n=1 Tax=Companilactobacillus kedongensis TaxID=2486004 RepID=UPI000F777E8F|nr:BspA family leucine-rich repeat surface protein [Companilactobacillus kedongensis]
MRFQQLKHRSNSILRKKLYKSGKNWIVKSSLSFAGGLILFGATQVINVSADTVPVDQSQSVDTEVPQTASKPNYESKSGTQNPTTEQINTPTPDPSEVSSNTQQNTNNTDPTTVTKDTNQSNNQVIDSRSNNITPQVKSNYSVQTRTPIAQANAESPVQEQTDNNQVTTQVTEATLPADKSSLGSCYYYIDDNEVLHITAGEFTQEQYDAEYDRIHGSTSKNVSSIFNSIAKPYNKISFDGKVIAHGSIANFFNSVKATEIDNIDNFDTSDVTDFSNFLANSKIQSFDLGKLDTSKATSMSGMFSGCTDLNSLNTINSSTNKIFDASKVTDFSNMFNQTNLTSIDLTGLDTSSANNINGMFAQNSKMKTIDVSGLDTSNVTNMGNVFHSIGISGDGFVDIKGLDKWDTSKVTDMSNMFANDNFDTAKIQHWDTSKVENMNGMFQDSTLKGELNLPNIVGESLTSMRDMFSGAKYLTKINLSNLDGSKLVDVPTESNIETALTSAFYNCSNLQEVDLDNFNSKNVNDYTTLFAGCPKLTTIKWPYETTDKATNFSQMFSGDSSLTTDELDFLKNFVTSNVTIFNNMFNGCTSITTLEPVESWDVSSGTDFSSMFQGDSLLTKLDLSNWNINNAIILKRFIRNCVSLTNLKLPNFDPKNSDVNMEYMLEADDKLNLLDLSKFIIPEDAKKEGMLSNVKHLYKLVLSKKVNLDGTDLSYFDIYKGWNNVGTDTDDEPESNLGLHDANMMMSTYSNNSGPDDTWVIAERKIVDYQIKYVDNDTKKDLNPDYDISGQYREGLDLSIPTLKQNGILLPGYDAETYYDDKGISYWDGNNLTETIPDYGTAAAKNLVYTVGVPKVDPFTIKISDVSNPIVLYVNEVVKDNKGLQGLNSTKQLDPDKTMLHVQMSGDIDRDYTETQYFDRYQKKAPTNIKNLIDLFFDLNGILNNGEVLSGGNLSVDVAYVPNTNNNNGNSGNGTVDRAVQDIDQTSATFSDRPAVQLYDFDGNVIANRKLGVNTDWYNDQEMTLNGQKYYRVSTDEWVKANDVYVYVASLSRVRTYQGGAVQMKNAHVNNARGLAPASDWKTDRYAIFNGQKYYRVSTNEFVPVNKVYKYEDSNKVIHSRRATPLYDEHGNSIGRTLNPDTDYKTDKYVEIGNEPYYRVSTNEFVKTNDID